MSYFSCLSNHLERKFKDRLVAAADFSFLTDETTDIGDCAKLCIFLRYIDSDIIELKEEFLGLVEVVGSKVAEALVNKIKDVFKEKGLDLSCMRFDGMDGTNTVSGERYGLQRRFRHEVPHSKYINCRNHKLALVFVHLLKDARFKCLGDVDALLLSVWKLMKYSNVKAAVFGEAQTAESQKKLKLLKVSTTRWLSHGDSNKRLVSRFTSLKSTLDALTQEKAEPEVKGICDSLLEPNTILMLLLLSDVLKHINRFSVFTDREPNIW